jgi:predicted  nucleic acid-binding Zn-ribbon protein
MAIEYDCIHEDLLQSQTKDLERLKTRADYKDKRIDDLYIKMEKMEEKIDKMNENIQKLIVKSNKGDTDLELRLKAIETELALQKQTSTDNHNRITTIVALVGVGLTIITILINVYFNMIP